MSDEEGDGSKKSNAPSDDYILVIYTNESASEYSLTVRSESGSPISSNDFILEVEMWLHSVTQAQIAREEPGTTLH